jgi:hypothetical protein
VETPDLPDMLVSFLTAAVFLGAAFFAGATIFWVATSFAGAARAPALADALPLAGAPAPRAAVFFVPALLSATLCDAPAPLERVALLCVVAGTAAGAADAPALARAAGAGVGREALPVTRLRADASNPNRPLIMSQE